MKAAIYARLSTEDERSGIDGASVERQIENARAFAASRGWTVGEVFEDRGVSGGEFANRPGLARMLEAAKRRPRPFDVIIMMSLDRLGREQVRTSAAFQELHEAGVAIYTYQDGREVRFETPAERLMVGVQGFAAEDYRYQIKAKTREALQRKARLGHNCGAKTYGYTVVRTRADGSPCPAAAHKQCCHAEQIIDEGQAKVVRRVFAMAAEGHGNLRIVLVLKAEGVPGPGKKEIGRAHV